jgi:hypothetical protein
LRQAGGGGPHSAIKREQNSKSETVDADVRSDSRITYLERSIGSTGLTGTVLELDLRTSGAYDWDTSADDPVTAVRLSRSEASCGIQ